jgi:hypothetical protein
MGGERAKTYADRLPPVVEREESDISHLTDEMADILYPGRRTRPFRITVLFAAFPGPEYVRAVDLARQAGVHRDSLGDARVHAASFTVAEAGLLRDLFEIVGQRPGTEVRVDGKLVPYARELWLPLFYLFVGAPA